MKLANAHALLSIVTGLAVTMALSMQAAQAAGSAVDSGLQMPQHDSEIVEVLRERPMSAQERAWRQLRQQARRSPADMTLASKVAWQALRWARRDGDPRLLGQAQAALRHWWKQPDPPADIRLLRATILQSTHDFDGAIKDLQALVRTRPNDPQAWLTLAAVHQVQGRYGEALNACQGLGRAGAEWHARVCKLELRSYTGDAVDALRELDALATQTPRELMTHLQLVRAELAERLGRTDVAARLYARLLAEAEGGIDAYVEGVYADLLLDQGQATKVISLLKERTRNDALLLRLAEAYAALGDPAQAAATQTLSARFEAARIRGDRVHLREEARFVLRLMKQPAQALALAQQNWQTQKEPADARILMEAARAASDAKSAEAVRRFTQSAGWTDRRLEALR